MPKKLLILASTFPRWEGDTTPPFIKLLAEHLTQEFEVHVLAPHYPATKIKEQIGKLVIHRYRYAPARFEKLCYEGGILNKIKKSPGLMFLVPFLLISQALTIRRLYSKNKYDAIHCHWIVPQGLAYLLSGLKAPWLITSHGGDLFALNNPLLKRLKIKILQAANHITVVSNAMKKECITLGLNQEKVSVLPMGVDTTNTFIPLVNSSRINNKFLIVGRLVKKKGIHVAIRALKLLKLKGIQVNLDIVGDGPELDFLINLCNEYALDKHINFIGAVENTKLRKIYGKADFFILPSIVEKNGDQEGLGLVTIEAMACGCIPICSDLEATKDVIADTENGLLFSANTHSDLANKIEIAISPLFPKEIIRKKAISSAKQFDWGHIGKQYIQKLNYLIGK